jgi:predicted transcriptional regulator
MSSKKIRVSYTISPELVSKLMILADTHNQSTSSVFEEAVDYFLKAVKQKEKEKMLEKKELEKQELEKQELEKQPKNILYRPTLLRRSNAPITHKIPTI